MERHTLIFDIETVGESWDALDQMTQDTLTRWIDRSARDEEAHAALIRDLKEGLGFSPLTGAIVAIGLYDLERAQGVVYFSGDETEDIDTGDFILKSRTEQEMLEDFWEGAQEYNTFVSFNGRGFDVPFLNVRSAVHGIRPTCDLMEGRYLSQQKQWIHIDLQDQLTYYGAVHRRPSLHVACRAFGIESPKTAGVQGDSVAALYAAKHYETIARYNARDVIATVELYRKWYAYLAPERFRMEES